MTSIPEKHDFDSNGWPTDWHNVVTAHGLSRSEANKRYHVRLSVAGKQFFIATASSQPKGARLYDLAVWKLAGFLTRCKANDLAGLSNLTQAMVDAECPALNEIYSQVDEAVGRADDLTERERREAAIERFSTRTTFTAVRPATSPYTQYQKQVNKMRVVLVTASPRLLAERLTLCLSKLPELQRAAIDLETKLAESEESLRQLQFLLSTHANLYNKVNDES